MVLTNKYKSFFPFFSYDRVLCNVILAGLKFTKNAENDLDLPVLLKCQVWGMHNQPGSQVLLKQVLNYPSKKGTLESLRSLEGREF